MSRAVTADHILFNECISAFRPSEFMIRTSDRPSFSYLLTSFRITTPWQLPNCVLHASEEVNLPGMKIAFTSKIENPEWCDRFNSHLFGNALSAIVTFITGRVCKSTRDDHLCNIETLESHQLLELAALHPIRTSGPGGTQSYPSTTTLDRYKSETFNLITQLNGAPYLIYMSAMQAIRLAHLSQLNKREDFGLGYLLIVSAIEAIAQFAFKDDKQARRDPREKEWSNHAKAHHDQNFKDLLAAYKDARGRNVTQLYIKFIQTFAPPSAWEQITPHPYQDLIDLAATDPALSSLNHLKDRRAQDIYPSDLNEEHITKIIKNSYTHRSCFVHRGEQPPHCHPNSKNRFFQISSTYKQLEQPAQQPEEFDLLYPYENTPTTVTEELLPNYELMVSIAKHSICTWIRMSTIATD